MKLIIAEKPSLARNIIAGLGEKMDKKDGYFIGENYIVSWAFGHLFSLADIETYTGSESARWTLDNLPCFPKEFKFELRRADNKKGVDSGVKKQFNILSTLCNRADVDTIINAGDADREGEIIVRLCVMNALKGEKRQMRLWLPDQTPETVAKAITEMKDEGEYDIFHNTSVFTKIAFFLITSSSYTRHIKAKAFGYKLFIQTQTDYQSITK